MVVLGQSFGPALHHVNEVILVLFELLFNLQAQVAATLVLSHGYFSSLSELNLSLQGTFVTVFSA
jgi:hypothetical protein